MFKLLFSKITTFLGLFSGFFSLFLLGRNAKLSKENTKLNEELNKSSQTIATQKKVINVIKNTKNKSISGNIKRMRNNKL